MNPSSIRIRCDAASTEVLLSGTWILAETMHSHDQLAAELSTYPLSTHWNCLDIEALDSAGAMLIWRSWGRQLPQSLSIRPEHARMFERLRLADALPSFAVEPGSRLTPIVDVGSRVFGFIRHATDLIALLGQLALDFWYVLRHPSALPRREISANLYKSGALAMPVTALVGFLIGIVLSYLSALQLRQFGADILIVNILGLGIIRELGPVLVAILVAGRSGSAMTAQLGVMRVTEEIDALATMGISRGLRLLLPKVIALAVTVPLLVLWASTIALVGGMIAAQLQLDISYQYFIQSLPRSVSVVNVWIGLGKGFVFGVCIALVACHFGLRVRPNTESLSANTTASVVTSITLVIVIDAIFAVAMRGIGVPRL